jgi:hypothetical protein
MNDEYEKGQKNITTAKKKSNSINVTIERPMNNCSRIDGQ